MERRLHGKILREEHHKAKEIAEKPVQHFDTEALSYSEACYWMDKFARGREQLEDARRLGQPLGFISHSGIQAARRDMLNESFRQLAEISHYSPSTVFHVRMSIFRLKFRHWKWIPHFRSHEDNRSECRWPNPWKFRWSKHNDETG
jgi:hypothetical protein